MVDVPLYHSSIKEPYTNEQLSKPNVIYKNEEEHKISLLSNQT